MGSHSVADAKNRLSELIDLALSGEGVVITRHGKPVVELRALPEPPRRMTEADIEHLMANRVGQERPSVDAGKFVREMRDED